MLSSTIAPPYVFLGSAGYVSHEGEKPMAITLRLHQPMSAELFQASSVAAAAIAGMALGGDRPEDLAVDYALSLAQVHEAIAYSERHDLAAA